MSDLEHLVAIQEHVLKHIELLCPKTALEAYGGDKLCYLIKYDNNTIHSVIDFEKTMPKTISQYQNLIQQSYAEWEFYMEPMNQWSDTK